MQPEISWSAPFAVDIEFGYLNGRASASKQFNPQLVLNTTSTSVLRSLREEISGCSRFTFSVAFVSPRGIALLKQEFADFEGYGVIVTSDYLGFNSPQAFHELINLRRLGIDVRLHGADAFHPKGYVFEYPDRITTILGSSNLTENALVKNHEWNLRVSARHGSDLADQFQELVRREIDESQPLTESWLAEYAASYVAPTPRRARLVPSTPSGEITSLTPNKMQRGALSRIASLRASGERRGLVISATGTGKTILAAFDVQAAAPRRFLFVVHREQILDKAIQEFTRVLGLSADDVGKLSGTFRDGERRYLFATIQTLSRPDVLQRFGPRDFDYILIDEVHRAGAESYRKVLRHFDPSFLLGVTATPERTDGRDIFEMFDYNVAYEIRLHEALDEKMLTPFHYFGIADYTLDSGESVGDFTDLGRLTEVSRVDYIVEALELYGQAGLQPRGLIFCSRKEEARELSRLLNLRLYRGRALKTAVLTGDDSIVSREFIVAELEAGDLDYVLTVDIFNEGVDIPSLNQVVMLRQTQSSIIFIQQLGRGLRLAPGKEYLVVIDFIGNYANNYMIPMALFGDASLSKESLRRGIIEAEERGVLAGLSSVRFDKISQQRVLASIARTRLDSLVNLRQAVELLQFRVGRVPKIRDFLRFESADPVLLATKVGCYPELIRKVLKIEHGFTPDEVGALNFMSAEALDAKRPHELILLRELLAHGSVTTAQVQEALAAAGASRARRFVESAALALTLDFHTDNDQLRYRHSLVEVDGSLITLRAGVWRSYREDAAFAAEVDDLIETGLQVYEGRYTGGRPFAVGRRYSRKDASRLLLWRKNMMSTIYGYKTDVASGSCPIFVTHHKDEDVSASTAYGDELLDRNTLRWFTRSRRSLSSGEVVPIVRNEVDLHVFMKQDDAEGADFYYLGQADAFDAFDTTMTGSGGEPLSVVCMDLRFRAPIDIGLYDYFHPTVTA